MEAAFSGEPRCGPEGPAADPEEISSDTTTPETVAPIRGRSLEHPAHGRDPRMSPFKLAWSTDIPSIASFSQLAIFRLGLFQPSAGSGIRSLETN